MMYRKFTKRVIDVLISGIVLILIAPLALIAVILIKLESPGPAFFVQERIGKDLNFFNILKFRTMYNKEREISNRPVIGKTADITKIGYILRRYKIDELPQLINVFKGEMSLVGPRPSVRSSLDNLTEAQKQRYSVSPGITGLAQVSGNIHLPWDKRIEYDLEYISKVSFMNDLKIVLRTISLILIGEEKFLNKPLNLK